MMRSPAASQGSLGRPLRVLILTAAVGSGHVVAGEALRDELVREGCEVVVCDGLDAMSPVSVGTLGGMYIGQVRHLPRPLALLLWVLSFRPPADLVRLAVGRLFGERLLAAIRRKRPDLVVSTYPLVTAALGYLRRREKLGVPAAALITDYGVHPLWVSPGVDFHLAASPVSAAMVERAGGKVAVAGMPLRSGFRSAPSREEARDVLGMHQDAFVALVVGGAWGIGDLEGCVRRVAGTGVCNTVVVTGRNEALKARLEKEYEGKQDVRVVGWTDQMPLLMAASDCLIQNAGGVTCLEAAEMGLPVILFDPIPGHGIINARAMERAGVARWARTGAELEALLKAGAAGAPVLASAPPELRSPCPPASAVLIETFERSRRERGCR